MSKFHDMIRKGDDPILKQVCATVLPGDDLIWMDKLERVCRKCHEAVGLAAPQIGVARRGIFIMVRDARGTVRGERLYNAEVILESPEREVAKEGCMSYPGVYKNISRPAWADIKYQKHPMFSPVTERFHGYRARVALHEIHHTLGICLVGDPEHPSIPLDTPNGRHGLAMVAAIAAMSLR